MFKVTNVPKFTHTVSVMVPTDGGHVEQTFKATFLVEDVEKLSEIQDEGGQKALLQRVVSHMDDLIGEDDQPLPYSDQLRDQLIGYAYVRVALFNAYLSAVTKAKPGN